MQELTESLCVEADKLNSFRINPKCVLSMLRELSLSIFVSGLSPHSTLLLIVVCVVLVLRTFEFSCLFREYKLKR